MNIATKDTADLMNMVWKLTFFYLTKLFLQYGSFIRNIFLLIVCELFFCERWNWV